MPYVEVLKKYAQFSGRAKRSEYWWFVLIHLIVFMTLFMLVTVTSVPGGHLQCSCFTSLEPSCLIGG